MMDDDDGPWDIKISIEEFGVIDGQKIQFPVKKIMM